MASRSRLYFKLFFFYVPSPSLISFSPPHNFTTPPPLLIFLLMSALSLLSPFFFLGYLYSHFSLFTPVCPLPPQSQVIILMHPSPSSHTTSSPMSVSSLLPTKLSTLFHPSPSFLQKSLKTSSPNSLIHRLVFSILPSHFSYFSLSFFQPTFIQSISCDVRMCVSLSHLGNTTS